MTYTSLGRFVINYMCKDMIIKSWTKATDFITTHQLIVDDFIPTNVSCLFDLTRIITQHSCKMCLDFLAKKERDSKMEVRRTHEPRFLLPQQPTRACISSGGLRLVLTFYLQGRISWKNLHRVGCLARTGGSLPGQSVLFCVLLPKFPNFLVLDHFVNFRRSFRTLRFRSRLTKPR